MISQELMKKMITPQHDDLLKLEGTLCRTGLGCYLKTIYGKKYFGYSGGNERFESLVNFSVSDGNGCCIFINSNDAYPLILKLQNEFLK